MTDPVDARNDNTDNTDSTGDIDDDAQLANPGPVPAAPEDSADTGEGTSGDLAAEARKDRDV